MARIRTIKPEFFDDPDISELSPFARLLFIGLWTQADREGRLKDEPRRLKARLFPFDNLDIEPLLVELHRKDLIRRYQVEPSTNLNPASTNLNPASTNLNPASTNLIWIRQFTKHQRPHLKEVASVIPMCQPDGGQYRVKVVASTNLNPASTPDTGSLILDTGSGKGDGEQPTPPASTARPTLSNALSKVSTAVNDKPTGKAPIHGNGNEHRKHAVCGRVCVHAVLHNEFMRRRNHDDANNELRAWYLVVENEWSVGAHAKDEPGDLFDFWRAQYAAKWPAKAVQPVSTGPKVLDAAATRAKYLS